jgi:hypothetical protein
MHIFILSCIDVIYILHQTNDYACTFHLVHKTQFLARNRKRPPQEKVGTNFFGLGMLFLCQNH